MNEALLPCPFCGQAATQKMTSQGCNHGQDPLDILHIGCASCGVWLTCSNYPGYITAVQKDELAARWNKRAQAAPAAVAGPHVTDAMALAFHSALSDGAIGSDEVEEIKAGLRAALDAAPTTQPAPQQEAQEQAAVPRFNCWTTNDGDSWFDHPADSQAIYDCLGNDAKVGDEYELTAGWRSVTARYRITEVVGDGEEYEVECISHQQENTAPQPASQGDALDAARLDWLDGDDGNHVSKVGKTWYTRPAYGRPYRKHKNLRAAIDAARAAQKGGE